MLIHGALNVIAQEEERVVMGDPGGMTETFQILILLLAVISVVGLVAKRLKIPPSILLVMMGVILALMPGLAAGRSRRNWSCSSSCRRSSTRRR